MLIMVQTPPNDFFQDKYTKIRSIESLMGGYCFPLRSKASVSSINKCSDTKRKVRLCLETRLHDLYGGQQSSGNSVLTCLRLLIGQFLGNFLK